MHCSEVNRKNLLTIERSFYYDEAMKEQRTIQSVTAIVTAVIRKYHQ